jgi:predicted membrane protein
MTPDPHGDRDRDGEHEPRHSWPLAGEHRHREMFSTRLIVGVLIMLLGGILLADNLGWIEARHVLRSLWPLVLVAIGVAMVRRPQHRRSREGGWVLITVGIWIFLSKIGWVHVSLGQLLLPAIFLFVGGVLVFRSLRDPTDSVANPSTSAPASDSAPSDHAEFVRSFAMLSGCELRPVSRPFRGADISAVMGGIKLDLSSARMEGDSAVIEVFAFWGGVEIYVPPDWAVTSEVTTLLAGFIDKRRPTSIVPTKNLVIKGMIVMSGVEIKN